MSMIDEAIRVFDLEIEALTKTRNSLDKTFDDIVDALSKCDGKVITVGLGKSGHVAKKIAATLSSLGTPSFFLSPSEALHGDLGMISGKDIVLLISNSGENEEIKAILPIIKEIGAKITAITSSADSVLAREADIVAVLPRCEEACRFGLAPTSSTTAAVCYGDALAVALSVKNGFKADDFRHLHPSGPLGKKK